MRSGLINSDTPKTCARSLRHRFATSMGLAATLLLAACSGSSSDDSTATNQVPADTETVADSEQQMPPPTSVEAPDVTGATDAGIATIDDDSSAALPTIEPDEPATDPETGPEPAEWPSLLAGATASGPPPVVDCPADSAPTSGEIPPTPEFLEPTIEAVIKGGRTGEEGQIGDGKLFVLPMEDCVRIRTGERGGEAI